VIHYGKHVGGCHGCTIGLRADFDADAIGHLARRSSDAIQTGRLLVLAVIYDGGRRGKAAVVGGVTLQIVRNWGLRFNAHGPQGLVDRKAPGATPKLNAKQCWALAERVELGPIPVRHETMPKAGAGLKCI